MTQCMPASGACLLSPRRNKTEGVGHYPSFIKLQGHLPDPTEHSTSTVPFCDDVRALQGHFEGVSRVRDPLSQC
jgi:hypothetical protein